MLVRVVVWMKFMCSSKCAIPVSPYPSFREPTRYVILTVTLGLDASGNSRKCSPLESEYSVMPSTEVTFWTPCGKDCEKAAPANRRKARTLVNRALRRIKARLLNFFGLYQQAGIVSA